MSHTPPKVFISHASEDKDYFVTGFAMKLRERGIDAWLDRWEMYPGDSLVDKIFEEGLKNAQAVVVVLSKASVTKPWVREELNVSVVKRINNGSRLIPVVIEDCEVPECLKSTLWERISDLGNYDRELARIVNSIYGRTDRPPLGEPPRYTQTIIDVVPGLTPLDSQVLVFSCEVLLTYDPMETPLLRPDEVFIRAAALGIARAEFDESLEVLESTMYLDLKKVIGGEIIGYLVTDYGLDQYVSACVPNYSGVVLDVAAELVNRDQRSLDAIAETLQQPPMLVNHVLKRFRDRGLITAPKNIRHWCGHVIDVSAQLRRMLRDGSLEA